MKRTLIAVVLVSALASACGAQSGDPQRSPTRPTTAPSPTPARTVEDDVEQAFPGSYWVHGAQLTIRPDQTGILSLRSYASCTADEDGPECAEKYTFTWSDKTRNELTAVVTRAAFETQDGTPVAGPEEPSSAVGDKFRLEFVKPGLLKTTILSGMNAFADGNPYWCSTELSSEQLDDYQQPCGA